MPFDRLWRSGNRIGPSEDSTEIGTRDGRLWETAESGHDGEPLGPENGPFIGEGKDIPAHLRKSFRTFIENVKCAQCNDVILERCEQCSIRMHCMGCRKTLCASCAFNRPIPRKRAKTRNFASLAFGNSLPMGTAMSDSSSTSASLPGQGRNSKATKKNRFWWAPGATRSPNLMNETSNNDDSSDSDDTNTNNNGMLPAPAAPPKLTMQWCCLEPIFSGGGGIAFLGSGLGGKGADKIRAAPLPRTKEYEDPDFSCQLRPVDYVRELKNNGLYEYVLGEDVDILAYLKQDHLDLQASTCPRGLCQDCYRSFRWKVACRGCKKPLCKEHDFRALKIRKCGFRDLHVEREYVRTQNEPPQLVIPAFKSASSKPADESEHDSGESLSTEGQTSSSVPEHSDSSPLFQSQILPSTQASAAAAPPPTVATMDLSAIDMSASTSLTSHYSVTAEPFLSINTTKSFQTSHSPRPRSLSMSGLRSRNSPAWPNSPRTLNPVSSPLPLPCNPRHPVQWEGCGAYFCQTPRSIGDGRPRCPSVLKECGGCGVYVCETCASTNPACPCTFCTTHYHCPHCARKKGVKAQCRMEEELKAKKDAEIKAKEEMEREKEQREKADQLAETVWEFWEGLMGDVIAETSPTTGQEEEPEQEQTRGSEEMVADEATVSSQAEPSVSASPQATVPSQAEATVSESPQATAPSHAEVPGSVSLESVLPSHPEPNGSVSSEPAQMSLDGDGTDEEDAEADAEDDDDMDAEGELLDELIAEGALD